MVGKRTRPKIANDITELIGNTPLLKLGRNAEGLDATILLKMEAMEVKRGRSALGGAWGGTWTILNRLAADSGHLWRSKALLGQSV